MTDGVLSYAMLAALMRDAVQAKREDSYLGVVGSPLGIPIRASAMFPYTSDCAKCGGSGSGGELSTYCQHCKGGGMITTHGVVMDGPVGVMDMFRMREPEPITLIVDYHPPKFQPSFPFALPVRPWPGYRA